MTLKEQTKDMQLDEYSDRAAELSAAEETSSEDVEVDVVEDDFEIDEE